MAIHPDSSFPVLAGDQIDVIEIFLELMSARERADRTPEVTTNQAVGSGSDSKDSWFPSEPLDHN